MKPEGLEGLLKFGMSKSHHITIRQQISFEEVEKQINDAILAKWHLKIRLKISNLE